MIKLFHIEILSPVELCNYVKQWNL
uniref:Uncharacterized protein n=1 Tax=Arundo donax TaxID=35708 RepID=A0A0A9AQ58_ARUDO